MTSPPLRFHSARWLTAAFFLLAAGVGALWYSTISAYEAILFYDSFRKLRMRDGSLLEHEFTAMTAAAGRAMDNGQIAITQAYHRGTGDHRHVNIAVPVIAGGGAKPRIAGALVLHLDPRAHLDPLLGKWPALSASGETFVVEKNEGEIISRMRIIPTASVAPGGSPRRKACP